MHIVSEAHVPLDGLWFNITVMSCDRRWKDGGADVLGPAPLVLLYSIYYTRAHKVIVCLKVFLCSAKLPSSISEDRIITFENVEKKDDSR